MHRSVLQNKKYIKFADENTVEVMSMSGIDQGIAKGDAKAATYKAKDENGNEVEFLVEFPGLTVEQVKALNASGARKYSDRGIPFTSIVNPHTLESMDSFLGGQSAGTIIDAVAAHKKALNKEYGKSLSRKSLRKIQKQERTIRADLGKGDLMKALSGTTKLEKSLAKKPEAMQQMARKVREDVLHVCGQKLDELEAMIGRGAKKDAAKELGSLARALKGTPLAERANDLLAKAKAE